MNGTSKTVERPTRKPVEESDKQEKGTPEVKGKKMPQKSTSQVSRRKEDHLKALERIVVKGTTDVEKEIRDLRKEAERQLFSLEGD